MVDVAIVHRDSVPGAPNQYDENDVLFVKNMIKEALDYLGGVGSFVKEGDRVVIKPNITGPILGPEFAAVTDPRVLEALVLLIKEECSPGEVIVAECSAFGWDTNLAFANTGIGKAVARAGGKTLCLEEDTYREVEIPGAKALLSVRLPETVMEADVFITVPKMKTHSMATVSLSLKNQQGILLWNDKKQCHAADLHQKFPDLYRVVKPNLAIVDGIYALQGQGPYSFNPSDVLKDMNVVVAGFDLVAVDAVASAVMGFNPLDVLTTRIAYGDGLGEADLNKINVKGNTIEEVKRNFVPAITDPRGAFPNVDIYAGGACQGCLNFLRFGLDILNSVGLLQNMGKTSIIIGANTHVPKELEGNVYIFGDCAKQHSNRGTYYPGCGPIDSFLEFGTKMMGLDLPKQKQV
jgi:uncharacterized protein (DUF362 family)